MYLGVKGSWLRQWVDELFSTESSVVGTLYIVRNYVKPAVLERIRDWKDTDRHRRLERAECYFRNLDEVLEIHKQMLGCVNKFRRELKKKPAPSESSEDSDEEFEDFETALGKTLELVAKIAEFFRLYGSYVKSYAGVNELFRMIVQRWDNREFGDFVQTECAGLSLQSMLIQPLQRLSKYELFFSDLEKRIDPAKVPVVKEKVSRTLIRIRKSVKAVEQLAKRLEAQDVVYDFYTELDHRFGCVDDMIQPHIFFLAEFKHSHLKIAYRRDGTPEKKKSKRNSGDESFLRSSRSSLTERHCEIILFTDFALVLVSASVRHRVSLGTKKKYVKFRLELTECIFVGHKDTGIWVLRDAAVKTSNSAMVHVHSPATKVTTETYIKILAPDRPTRDDILRAFNDQKLDLRDRRDSFCCTPGSCRSTSSVRSANYSSLFIHSPRRLPSTPTFEPTWQPSSGVSSLSAIPMIPVNNNARTWGSSKKKKNRSQPPPSSVPFSPLEPLGTVGSLTTIDETNASEL